MVLDLIVTGFGLLALGVFALIVWALDRFVIVPLGERLEGAPRRPTTPRLNVLIAGLCLVIVICLLYLVLYAAHHIGCFFLL